MQKFVGVLVRFLQVLFLIALCVSVLAGTFGFGGWMLAINGQKLIEGWQSRSWPDVPATVTRSEAVYQPSPGSGARTSTSTTHVVKLRYEYTVDGRDYIGLRNSLDNYGIGYSSEKFALNAIQALPVGKSVRAFYDPDDPSRSLLVPGLPVSGFIGILVVALLPLAAGFGIVAAVVYLVLHHRRKRLARGGR